MSEGDLVGLIDAEYVEFVMLLKVTDVVPLSSDIFVWFENGDDEIMSTEAFVVVVGFWDGVE